MNITIQGFLVTSHVIEPSVGVVAGRRETALKRILNFKVPPSAHKKD
jgi:hypothetical protein